VCAAKYSLKGFPPMALSESAVSELLEVLRSGDAVDLIRESVRMVLQELIETEASDVIGAARYERTDSRVNERNGSRPLILATQAGDIDLWIGLDEVVTAFRTRRLDHTEFPYVYLDTTYLHLRNSTSQVASRNSCGRVSPSAATSLPRTNSTAKRNAAYPTR
jgi:transposase-like protein